jgi:signal transduction histidine kinase
MEPTPTLRVLHIEDDPVDAALVEATLATDGLPCTVTRVDSRASFAGALANGSFDIILADYSLPSFDGATAQRLAQTARPDIPFIFVSGTLGEEVAVDRLRSGATDYVLKQRLTRLPAVVRRALREAHDRVERRRAEEEARRLNLELDRRAAERTAQAAASRAKTEFLSRMSHDLRTPLNAVLGFAQLLEIEVQKPEQRDAVEQILKGGRLLLEMINEVCDISRIESGHLSVSPEPVGINDVTQHAIDLVRPLARQRGILLHSTPTNPERHVMADRQRLTQVLLNLLSNAVKYNRESGDVRLWCDEVEAVRLRIHVQDTGAGIRPEKMDRLFVPFERLGAEETAVEGTGLGLALSKRLSELMGGTLGVHSVQDAGSTFWVELPLAPPPSQDVPGPDSRQTLGDATPLLGTVLYVEDNRSNRRLMERVMARRPGVRLLSAASGRAGIELVRAERPDLVILDLHLPDMTGEDVLRQLWEDRETRGTPVAVLSADATPGQIARLRVAGATAYLTKPLNVAELLALVDDQLEHVIGASTKASQPPSNPTP